MAINRRRLQEVNAGSMADIAFLLLIFFLVATTISVDTGLRRVLPPWTDESHRLPEISKRNLLEIKVNKFDQVSLGSRTVEISEVKELTKLFITNPDNDPEMAGKTLTPIDIIGDFAVSEGVVSIQNDRQTSYQAYIEVQNELSKAFNELREEVALSQFGQSYARLDGRRRAAVNKAVPIKISEAEPVNVE